ncbi:MAG: hypothetical protein GSR80_001785 [Desulfurococcales archaeon]|nr:hypothetical protein [Desulfurococcales archaeon]
MNSRDSILLSLAATRELIMDEARKLEKMEAVLADSGSPGLHVLREWIVSLRGLAQRVFVVEDYLKSGLRASASLEACSSLEVVYRMLSGPRDPVYENVKVPLASLAALLQRLCGDER